MSADVLPPASPPEERITSAQQWLDRFHDDRSVVRRPPRGPSWGEEADERAVRRDFDPFV